VFKFWCAAKTEQGCKYFIGQHGNNYGTLNGTKGIPEYSTSDCFLSWGWKDEELNAVPLFNFKIAGKKKKTVNNKGGLLIVNKGPGKRDGPQDRFYENKKYQQAVSNFYLSLDKNIRKQTIVRMHQISYNTNSDDRIHWDSCCKDVNIDNGLRPINKLIDDCKIVVFTYDSTGVLESLALNRPTICYWPSGIGHLLPEAIPHYKKLISAGIISDNPSELISNVWNDVDSWWYSNEIQNAVNEFCNQYSRTIEKPIYTLKDKLISIL
jgi:putative transferase (TIGR04331 family)